MPRAAVLCVRARSISQLRTFDSLADAMHAAERLPCGHDRCSNHVIAWREDGVIGTHSVMAPRPTALAEQL